MSRNNFKITNKRNQMLLGETIVALVSSSILSFALVSMNVYLQCSGDVECFENNFLKMWPRSFAVAFALVIPIVLLVAPFIVRITSKIA